MKILWHSAAPFCQTGYGTQTAQATRRLTAAGHDVAIAAYFGLRGSMMEWEGMPVYPGDNTGYGGIMLPHYAGHFAQGEAREDVLVITLQDVWTLNEHHSKLAPLNLASWVPVDCKPLSPRVHQFFDLTGSRPIAMSKFGRDALADAGLDPLYVPHGIDTGTFTRQPDRAAIRRAMKVPEDAFVVGMVAYNAGTNPPRKSFPQVFQAFARFRREHPDAVLYIHSDLFGMDSGINLMALKEICGIPDEAFAFSNQLALQLGTPASKLAELYTGFDVLANPSYGEGFGIPIVEAQACGCPVLTSNWTSMPELTAAGWCVSGDAWYVPQYGAFWLSPSVVEIYEALESAYVLRDDEGLRDKGREFALQYDADRVFDEHWLPALDELAKTIELPVIREVVPA